MPEVNLIDVKTGLGTTFPNSEEATKALKKVDRKGGLLYSADPRTSYMMFNASNKTIAPASGEEINNWLGSNEFYSKSFANENHLESAKEHKKMKRMGEVYEDIYGGGVIDTKTMAKIYGTVKGFMPIGVESAAENAGLGDLAKYLRTYEGDTVENLELAIPLGQLALGLGGAAALALAGSTAAVPTAIGAGLWQVGKHLPKWILQGGPSLIKALARMKAVKIMTSGTKKVWDLANWQMHAVDKAGRLAAKAPGALTKAGGWGLQKAGVTRGTKVATKGAVEMTPKAAVPLTNFMVKKGADMVQGGARAVAHSATTGAAYSVGQAEVDHLMGDVELSAENFLNYAKNGALFDVGLWGVVLGGSAAARMLKRGVAKLPIVGAPARWTPDLPVIDLSGNYFDMQKGLFDTAVQTTKPTDREKWTLKLLRQATVNGKVNGSRLNTLLKKSKHDPKYIGDLHYLLNEKQIGLDAGLDGPIIEYMGSPEQIQERIDQVMKYSMNNRDAGIARVDNSERMSANRALNSKMRTGQEEVATQHILDVDAKIQDLQDLQQRKKDLEAGKDAASSAALDDISTQKVRLEALRRQIEAGDITMDETISILNDFDTSADEEALTNLIRPTNEDGGVGDLAFDVEKRSTLSRDQEAYDAMKREMKEAQIKTDDYIYEGKLENINAEDERGLVQGAMNRIMKTLKGKREGSREFQAELAETLSNLSSDGGPINPQLISDLGWEIYVDDAGEFVLQEIRRSDQQGKKIAAAPLSTLGYVAYDVMRVSRDMFTEAIGGLKRELKAGELMRRSDITARRQAMGDVPKPPNPKSAAYNEGRVKALAKRKLSEKKRSLGELGEDTKRRAKQESAALDVEMDRLKKEIETLNYDVIPSTANPNSRSVRFNSLADQLLLKVKKHWAMEHKINSVGVDTPYSKNTFREGAEKQLERAEEIAAGWRRNGDGTTFEEAQRIKQELSAITYDDNYKDWKDLNRVNDDASKMLRKEFESQLDSSSKWALGEAGGTEVLGAYVQGNRTYSVLKNLLNATATNPMKQAGSLIKMSYPFFFFMRKAFPKLSSPAIMGLMVTKNALSNTMNFNAMSDRYHSKFVHRWNKMNDWSNNLSLEMSTALETGRDMATKTTQKFVDGLGITPSLRGKAILRLGAEAHVEGGRFSEERKRKVGRPRKPVKSEPVSGLYTPVDVLGVNREADYEGDSRRDAYWKRAREINAVAMRPLDATEVMEAAYEPVAMFNGELAEHIRLNVQKDMEFLGTLITKRYDMQGNPDPTSAEMDQLELALNVVANTEASIYDRFVDGTLDNFSMRTFEQLRPKAAIEFKQAVAQVQQEYGDRIPYQKQLLMAKVTNMSLGSMPTALLTNTIQSRIYAPEEVDPKMGQDQLDIGSREETPLEKGVQRDEWGTARV